MPNEKILNVKENKESKVEVDNENTKIKNVISYDNGKNFVNIEKGMSEDNKDVINITNEQNELNNNNFMISNSSFSKNENINNNLNLFTSDIKEKNIIPNTKVVKKKQKENFIWKSFHE